jgi:2-polyprenyl-6-methoxyphenol hydroxylase-like FAD-dependent oxidoreductase
MGTAAGEHAVVLGAGLAGLLAAGVLAEHYRTVTVLDRDRLTAGPAAPRRGVPQGGHLHALLARGREALDDLLPGLTAQLVAAGAPVGDMQADARSYLGEHRIARGTSGLGLLCASRPLLEHAVRARVVATPGVVVAARCAAVGLQTSADRRRVTGVQVRREGCAEEVVPADLVLDATGRGSRVPRWLAGLDLPEPVEERVPIGLGYATRTYRPRPEALGGDLGVIAPPTPPAGRGGGLSVLEGDRWMLTLIGVLGDHPPTDPAGFDEFVRSLPTPDIADALAGAEPLDDPLPFRFPASVRRRYERLSSVPDGLLVVGDAVCSLNPVRGQGMTVAALEALALRRALRAGRVPRPRAFHREVARIVDAAWDIVVGGDLAFPGVEGRRTRKLALLDAYLRRLGATAAHDPAVGTSFLRVAGLVDPPRALLRPGVLWRVLHGPGPGTARNVCAGATAPADWPDAGCHEPAGRGRRGGCRDGRGAGAGGRERTVRDGGRGHGHPAPAARAGDGGEPRAAQPRPGRPGAGRAPLERHPGL